MIELSKNLKLKVLKKVKVKDNCWNSPGFGYLNPGTIIKVIGGPTRISDVPLEVISGSGEYTPRGTSRNTTYPIIDGSKGLFFVQGHETNSPYDWGTLSNEFYQEVEL